jgi:phage repressor protein C with HTH and peptisase S24 domain
MAPRFHPGDPAYVDPRATPRIGDDVVVYLRKSEGDEDRVYSVLLKELARATSSFVELKQHKPNVVFTVPRKDIAMIHRIIPWRELTMF